MGLELVEIEGFSEKGTGICNEDIYGYTKNGAWVIDGATGLNGRNLVDTQSDAGWFVKWWDSYLRESIDDKKSLTDIMIEGVRRVNRDFKNAIKDEAVLENMDYPSASICVVKILEDYLEFLVLGDCNIYLSGIAFNIIKDEKITVFDNIVYDAMKKLDVGENLTIEEKKARVIDKLVINRALRNTEEGYWILGFEEAPIKRSINGRIRISEDLSILMASDGFTCGCERYGLMRENEMIEACVNGDMMTVYKKIREFELEDEYSNLVPRFKLMDDATCLLLKLSMGK